LPNLDESSAMPALQPRGRTTGAASWHRLNELFAAALECGDHAAQLEFVRRAAHGDAELQAAVEEMLQASRDANASGFLRGDALRAGAVAVAEREDASAEGRRIGDYRIVREIGRGGMGTVFLAERQHFRQRVALKVIKRGMDTDEIVRRFEREREVLADLSHPNIARLLDGGTTADGLPYFVMEYVDGKPITDFCDEKRLSIEERLRLFQKLCGAVAYIHKRSIIHRDIKPSNAVIDSDGEPKLLDFGIAKLLAPVAGAQTALTLTEAEPRLLTPDYASPEQLRGERVTPASDVYALGVLLYELLSGHRPFRRAGTGSRSGFVDQGVDELPPAPSTAALTTEEIARADGTKQILSPDLVAASRNERPEQLRRSLRGDLDLIALKAVRQEPEQRYPSVEALMEDLRRHHAGVPITARPLTAAYRAAKLLRRKRAELVAAAIGIAAIGLASLAYTYIARPTPAAQPASTTQPATRSIAVMPFKNVSGTAENEIFADGLTESLIASLSKVDEVKVISRHSAFTFKGRDGRSARSRTAAERCHPR
jgi:serine/threonine protein kinase